MQADPRIFFASERTLLAWVRAGVTIVSLGFVVSRFGLFLRVLAAQLGAKSSMASGHGYSNLLGIGLILLGGAVALWLSGLVAAASALLAVYLAMTA